MKVLLTGSTGYLGGWTAEMLVERGHSVALADSHGNWRLLGDMSLYDTVVHLGWYSSAGDGQKALQLFCYEQTELLIGRMTTEQSLVFASTATVYGDHGDKEFAESDPVDPNCAYSKCKFEAEEMVRLNVPNHHVYRFGSLMGLGRHRTKTQLCVNSMAKDGWLKKRIEVWNPEAFKPVLHVKDAAELLCLAVERHIDFGTYNASNGSFRAQDIAFAACAITGAHAFEVPDQSGPRSCQLNLNKIRWALPYKNWRGIDEAIREFEGFKESPDDINTPWDRPRPR